MGPEVRSDEDLLSARDGATFELFYRRYADRMLGYFVRRTHDAELAADLTAETFAAALTSRRRYRAEAGNASAWLFGIASKKLIDAQRRGYAERRAQRRLGMERIALTDDDVARIESLEDVEAGTLIDVLVPDQRFAVQAHIVEEREYGEIADDLNVSEAVVRKRVSRGLAALRHRMGADHDR
jgi:RNA polymerase sigma factor (sigma-70 family)